MSVNISPLDLLLDDENPRFVVLHSKKQADIRKYLVTYEDVCDLAVGINNYGGILPGERIVALKRGDHYVVIEGNRRTCSLQLLLNPDLIPDGFRHRIPAATEKLKKNCQTIEIDIVPNRDAALELMTKRHIEGVKQWKPLAKKQFFATNYAAGQSVDNLSRITGMREGDIKSDIKDYKFFLAAYTRYCADHPDYEGQIIDLKIDPFLRIFKAKFMYNGVEVKPVELLKISHTDRFETISALPDDVFTQIVQAVFEEATITERINTRNTLKDVTGVIDAINSVPEQAASASGSPVSGDESENGVVSGTSITNGEVPVVENLGASAPSSIALGEAASAGINQGGEIHSGASSSGSALESETYGGMNHSSTIQSGGVSGGPAPGGPAPRTFFETLSWDQKLSPNNSDHVGLLSAVHELYNLSITSCGRKKAYEVFPVATGMILRTAYEQVLKLRLKQTNLWGSFMQTVRPQGSFPTLSAMETFIDNPANKTTVLPTTELRTALSLIIRYSHREFLNANIHTPGDIHVSPESLSAIAQGGMYTLIQESINFL